MSHFRPALRRLAMLFVGSTFLVASMTSHAAEVARKMPERLPAPSGRRQTARPKRSVARSARLRTAQEPVELAARQQFTVDPLRPPPGEMPRASAQSVFAMSDTETAENVGRRHWASTSCFWAATALCHRPLYFEEAALERHGQSRCRWIQPAISAAHFYGSVVVLPYKMGLERPRECIYTLRPYRPGSPTPPMREGLPLELDAVLFQAAAVTGVVFLIP